MRCGATAVFASCPYGCVVPLNPPRRVLRVLRVLRVTCVSILALLWRTTSRFPCCAGAWASQGEAPRLPRTPCRTGGGSRYEDGYRGQDDERRHPRIVEGWEGWEGEDGWEGEGSEGFFSPLGEPGPERPDPDESRARQSSQPALRVPPWEVAARKGSFSRQASDWWRCNMWYKYRFLGCTIMEYYGDRTCSARSTPSTSELVVSRKTRYHTCCLLLCGGGIEVETPPLRCRLLCGRGIEAPKPPKKNTDTALCYVCCVLRPTVPLDYVWRVLRVLRVLGVASCTASGV